jgi:hypothetical protein
MLWIVRHCTATPGIPGPEPRTGDSPIGSARSFRPASKEESSMLPHRRGRRFRRPSVLAVSSLIAAVTFGVRAAPAGAATMTINVNGGIAGRTFDGVGAISGGGGNSRLLIDYPVRPSTTSVAGTNAATTGPGTRTSGRRCTPTVTAPYTVGDAVTDGVRRPRRLSDQPVAANGRSHR